MKIDKDQAVADRRSFLKLAGASAVLSVAAAVGGASVAQAAEDKARDEGRYHESAHVKRYYDLAKF